LRDGATPRSKEARAAASAARAVSRIYVSSSPGWACNTDETKEVSPAPSPVAPACGVAGGAAGAMGGSKFKTWVVGRRGGYRGAIA
jgi:hypothetical protein